MDDRRRCVEVLRGAGKTQAEIGRILRVCDRTVRRDLAVIRDSHAPAPDPDRPERIIEGLWRHAECAIAHLRRLARDQRLPGMARITAESSAWKVYREMFERLQSVGYLPRVPRGMVVESYERLQVDGVAAYADLADQIREIEAADRGPGAGARSRRRQSLLGEVEDAGRNCE